MATSGINPVAFAQLCAELNKQPCCRTELMEKVGITAATLIKWLRLLKAQRLIYVDHWKKTEIRGYPVEYLAWGYKMEWKSPPRPKPASGAESCRRYRNKVRALAEKHNIQKHKGGKELSLTHIQKTLSPKGFPE
jgi:hypothetical protein